MSVTAETTYIFGYNENSVNIYKSCNGKCVICDDFDNDEVLKVDGISRFQLKDGEQIIASIIDQVFLRDVKIVAIINFEDEEKTLYFARRFSQKICDFADGKDKAFEKSFARLRDEAKDELEISAVKNQIDGQKSKFRDWLLNKLNVYFFCESDNEEMIDSIEKSSCGCVRYKNKYRMMAVNFIERYPLSVFMNGKQLDYESATVKDGMDINVCMIGFGKTNQEIFLTSVANNQFLKKADVEYGVEIKQVKYHIFDKAQVEKNEKLNQTYYRYYNECHRKIEQGEFNESDYLPLPQFPALEEYYHCDLDDGKFLDRVKHVVRKKSDANFAIISLGDESKNMQFAYELVQKRKEWGVENFVIFVKASQRFKTSALFDEPNVMLIGDEATDVYNIDEIADDAIYRMAKMRNYTYQVEYEVSQEKRAAKEENLDLWKSQANVNWYLNMSETERDSSLYGVLSIRSKLNLIGLDYRKSQDADSTIKNRQSLLSYDEYMDIYAKGDKPKFYELPPIEGRRIVKYPLDFSRSLRTNLAILEHLRWNAYMISKGMIPSTKDQILNEKKANGGYSNGKNYKCLRHGNLTTFEGLFEFRRMVARRDGKSELSKDVVKYDYQLMDDAYWLLDKNGYEIIKRNDTK